MTLPDCMMPDGAEPCIAYQELEAERDRLREALEHLSEYLEYLGYYEKVDYIKKALKGG